MNGLKLKRRSIYAQKNISIKIVKKGEWNLYEFYVNILLQHVIPRKRQLYCEQG